jgi:hypothetical protein
LIVIYIMNRRKRGRTINKSHFNPRGCTPLTRRLDLPGCVNKSLPGDGDFTESEARLKSSSPVRPHP